MIFTTAASVFVLLMLLSSAGRSLTSDATPIQAGGLASLPERTATEIPLDNSGFESGETGWSFGSEKAFAIDKSEFHAGTASLRFDASVKTKYTPSVRYPLPIISSGSYRLRFWIKTAQLEGSESTSSGVRASIEYSTGGGKRGWKATQVFAGSREWELCELAVILPETLDKGSASISLHRYGPPLTGQAWFDELALERIEPPPIQAFLCYPNFRGFLPPKGPEKIRLWIRINDPARHKQARIAVRKTDGTLVENKTVGDLGSDGLFEIGAGLWPPGEYHIAVSAGNYHYPDYIIQKVSKETYQKLAVRFDPHNVLSIRGVPTFPLGLYVTSGYSNSPESYLNSHLKKMSEAPINFLINYWQTGAPVEATRAYLAAQRKYGINYLATVNNFYPNQYPATPLLKSILPGVSVLTTPDQADSFVGRYAEALRNEPNLAGWYVMDERPSEAVPAHFRQYQALRRADPDHLTLGISNVSGELVSWRNTVDVLGMDPYPLFNMKLGTPLSQVGSQTRAAMEATHGSRPVWMVLQFFQGWSADRWPTEEELRTMSLMAITEGARGLFYWSFGARGLAWVKDPSEKEAYWQRLVKVTKELKSLEPALLAPDAPELITNVSDARIRWRVREVNRQWYVFAYYPADKFDERFTSPALNVTFTFKDGRTATRAFRPDTADWFTVERVEN